MILFQSWTKTEDIIFIHKKAPAYYLSEVLALCLPKGVTHFLRWEEVLAYARYGIDTYSATFEVFKHFLLPQTTVEIMHQWRYHHIKFKTYDTNGHVQKAGQHKVSQNKKSSPCKSPPSDERYFESCTSWFLVWSSNIFATLHESPSNMLPLCECLYGRIHQRCHKIHPTT